MDERSFWPVFCTDMKEKEEITPHPRSEGGMGGRDVSARTTERRADEAILIFAGVLRFSSMAK